MGCASSSPLIESGKNFVDSAKDSAGEVIAKGEKTLQDVGETVKEKITTEMDHVKEAMQSAMNTAENSIGSVIGKMSNDINSTTTNMKDTVENLEEEVDETLNVVSDSAAEAVSEAETVLASEAENAKEMISSTATEAFEKFDKSRNEISEKMDEVKENLEETLLIEDVEQHLDVLGDSVSNVEKKIEEIVTKLPTPDGSPIKEIQKEEPPPTFWEAAADAILEQRSLNKSSMDFYVTEEENNVEKNLPPNSEDITDNEKLEMPNSTPKSIEDNEIH